MNRNIESQRIDPNGQQSSRDAASLESILRTEELRRRPSRPPNYAKENRALVALGQTLADSPHTVLQTLADTILEVCEAGSAGISLLTTHDDGKQFFWPAIAGKWESQIGGGTPRDFGPCGDVLDRNTPLLFTHVERRYPYFEPVKPLIEEALLVPFYVVGDAVGTIWAIAHDSHKFDAEDERMLSSLGKFASSAYQVVVSLTTLKFEVADRTRIEDELRMSEERLRTVADGLELKMDIRTRELEQRNEDVLRQSEELRELSKRLRQSQDDERRRIARELHDSAGQIVASLGMNLARISEALKPSDELSKTVQEGERLVQQLGQEIRTVTYLLHPPLLDENGLPEALRWYLQGIAERCGLKVDLVLAGNVGRLSEEIELAVFRIVQECLTNIHRHSGSKTATIKLTRNPVSFSVEIQDFGVGISVEKLSGVRSRSSGVGITGMHERVRYFAGTMNIDSSGTGTKISITLPISEKPAEVPRTVQTPRTKSRAASGGM